MPSLHSVHFTKFLPCDVQKINTVCFVVCTHVYTYDTYLYANVVHFYVHSHIHTNEQGGFGMKW